MLNAIEVNAFLRIPYLKVGLAGAAVHVFCGPNEAGKSSLGEAIRFALRGLSPRVRKKGQYAELIYSNKKSGSVSVDLDGFPVYRNVKDGKVATKATLDYPDLLVDIQLGAEEFARCDEKQLRSMLNDVFKVGTPDEFIRERLKARGVTDDMMSRTLPLIRVSGFEAAAEAAKNEQSRARGEWEGITHETYGHVKAKDWQPEILNSPAPDSQAMNVLCADIEGFTGKRDELNRRLGAISEALRVHADGGDTPVAELERQLEDAEENHIANQTALRTAQQEYRATVEELEDQVKTLEREVQTARQATATLDCPCCGAKLNIKTRENVPLLVKAEVKADSGADIRSLTEALAASRSALETTRADQDQAIEALRAALTKSQLAIATAEAALEKRRAAVAQPAAAESDVEKIAEQIAELDQKIAAANAKLQDLDEYAHAYARAIKERDRAAEAARLTAQWALLAEALGAGPDGIPAELVAATTRPINSALTKLALPLDTPPIVMGSDLSISRADGTPYYLLSESAKWKANAMLQLALATQSELKLVVLDGFDVIQATDRDLFFDMLTDFTAQHPDITVIALGTLKAKPTFAVEGVRFHWIENGQLKEAA
jgi:DNA-directed RNA polymerase subunit RPC12/RpoP